MGSLIKYLMILLNGICGVSTEKLSKTIYPVLPVTDSTDIYVHLTHHRLKFEVNLQIIGIGVIVVSCLALGHTAIHTDVRPRIVLFIVIGSIVFLVSFIGCCAVIKKSKCLMSTVSTERYTVLLV